MKNEAVDALQKIVEGKFPNGIPADAYLVVTAFLSTFLGIRTLADVLSSQPNRKNPYNDSLAAHSASSRFSRETFERVERLFGDEISRWLKAFPEV
jgi:hypothetical protein